MANRKPIVRRCTPRQDGGYLVVLSNGAAGVSTVPLNEGDRADVDRAGKIMVPA